AAGVVLRGVHVGGRNRVCTRTQRAGGEVGHLPAADGRQRDGPADVGGAVEEIDEARRRQRSRRHRDDDGREDHRLAVDCTALRGGQGSGRGDRGGRSQTAGAAASGRHLVVGGGVGGAQGAVRVDRAVRLGHLVEVQRDEGLRGRADVLGGFERGDGDVAEGV